MRCRKANPMIQLSKNMKVIEFKIIHVKTSDNSKVRYPYLVYKLAKVNSKLVPEYRLLKQFRTKESAQDYISEIKSKGVW